MFSHITIGTTNIEKAAHFYDAVMQPLGFVRRHTYPDAIAYGPPEQQKSQLWIMTPFNGKPAQPGNGWHAAFLAPDRAAVDAFHAAALKNGGTDEGQPGLREHYHPTYYAAYVRDLDGNKIQAVNHGDHWDVI